MDFDIRAMRSDDWPAVRNIYAEGIAEATPRLKRKFQSGRSGIKAIFKTAVWLRKPAIGFSAGQRSVQYPTGGFIPVWLKFRST